MFGHADNGGGVQATTQLRENGRIGAQAASNRVPKEGAEMFLVLGFTLIADGVCDRRAAEGRRVNAVFRNGDRMTAWHGPDTPHPLPSRPSPRRPTTPSPPPAPPHPSPPC